MKRMWSGKISRQAAPRIGVKALRGDFVLGGLREVGVKRGSEKGDAGHIPALKMAQYGIIGGDFILSSCLKSSVPLMEGRNAGLLSLAHISMQYVFSKQSADLCELHSNGNDLVLRYPVSFSKFMQRPIRQIGPFLLFDELSTFSTGCP